MNKKALHTLEYDKIIDTLTEFAYSQAAKEQCRNLLPMTDLEAINTAQRQTDDALYGYLKKAVFLFPVFTLSVLL